MKLSAGVPGSEQPHPKVEMEQLARTLGDEVDLVKHPECFIAKIAALSIEDARLESF